jgi:hypothetical protein
MLFANPSGSYHFLAGIEPYSSGVIADPDFEIIHTTLRRPVPWRDGFRVIDERLRAAGRPRAALCGVELRSPAPFTRAGFIEFNAGYRSLLEEWDLLVDGRNPVARTNVAPLWSAPDEPSLYGFSYTVPAAGRPPSFVVAGAGELRGGPLLEAAVIRPGETGPEAMAEKAAYVMRAIGTRLDGLGVTWADVTATDVYTVQPLHPFIESAVLEQIGPAANYGLHWHPARPPIDELEFEMDARGVRLEEWI